jgi:AcrR family transcriptional regulator
VSTVDRPLRKDAERNRQRILDAAAELFAQRGLGVTLNEIAHHAGVGVGTVYRRFRHRDEIVVALFEQRMRDYAALAEEAGADPDPWNGLVTFLERSLAMQAADRGLKALLVGHSHADPRVARVRERVLPVIERLVARAHAAGALRPDVGALDLPMVSLMIGQVTDFSEDVAPGLWRRYLALLLDALRSERTTLPLAPLAPDQLDAAMAAWQPPRRRSPDHGAGAEK